MCAFSCAFICVRSHVCSHICALIYVLSCVCAHVCALNCSHMCALIVVLSYGIYILYVCVLYARLCTFSYTCSFMRALQCALMCCVPVCSCFCSPSTVWGVFLGQWYKALCLLSLSIRRLANFFGELSWLSVVCPFQIRLSYLLSST